MSVNPKDKIGLTKTPLRLVPPSALVEVAEVMALGAAKYGPYNWRDHAVGHSVYLEAALRHIYLALDGEDQDDESGSPHEAHAAACMLIVLDAWATGNLIEDRFPSGAVASAMEHYGPTDPEALAPDPERLPVRAWWLEPFYPPAPSS